MQSQLEAALLGQSSVNTNTTVDEEDNNFQEEENEDVEDFIDEVSILRHFLHVFTCVDSI